MRSLHYRGNPAPSSTHPYTQPLLHPNCHQPTPLQPPRPHPTPQSPTPASPYSLVPSPYDLRNHSITTIPLFFQALSPTQLPFYPHIHAYMHVYNAYTNTHIHIHIHTFIRIFKKGNDLHEGPSSSPPFVNDRHIV